MADITFDELVGIDWNELLEKVGDQIDRPALVPGRYTVQIRDVDVVYTGSMNPTYHCTALVTDEGPHHGSKVWFKITVPTKNNNAALGFIHVLSCLGVNPGMAIGYRETPSAFARLLWNRSTIVEIRNRRIEGQDVPTVVGFNPTH